MQVSIVTRYPERIDSYFSSLVCNTLNKTGIEIQPIDASNYIPKQTDRRSCLRATKKLRKIFDKSDLIHALDYRTAWACADALTDKKNSKQWIYSAADYPKTEHPELIKRLEQAKVCLCFNQAIHQKMRELYLGRFEVIYPPISAHTKSEIDFDQISCFGLSESNLQELQKSLEVRCPEIQLNSESFQSGIIIESRENIAFSDQVIRALQSGAVAFAKQNTWLEFEISDHVNGYIYESDWQLHNLLATFLSKKNILEQTQIKSEKHFNQLFSVENYTKKLENIYSKFKACVTI